MEEIINQEDMIVDDVPEMVFSPEEPEFDIADINADDYEFLKIDLQRSNPSLETLICKVDSKFSMGTDLFIAMSKDFLKDHLDYIVKAFFMNSSKLTYEEFVENYNVKYNIVKEDELVKEDEETGEEATVSVEE